MVFGKNLPQLNDTLYFHNDKILRYLNFENKTINIKDFGIKIPKEKKSYFSFNDILKPKIVNDDWKVIKPNSFMNKLIEEKFLSAYVKQYSYQFVGNYSNSKIQCFTISFRAKYDINYLKDNFILLFIFKDSILKSVTKVYDNNSGLGVAKELNTKHIKDNLFLLLDILNFSDSSGDNPQIRYCKFRILDTGFIQLQNEK